jgi:hypothetical protein
MNLTIENKTMWIIKTIKVWAVGRIIYLSHLEMKERNMVKTDSLKMKDNSNDNFLELELSIVQETLQCSDEIKSMRKV